MQKPEMREYVLAMEERLDSALDKWKRITRVENGEVVQLEYQFEQSRILVHIFYLEGDEHISVECIAPRSHSKHEWRGLGDNTIRNLMDRVFNFAQVAQSPHR